ncbi:MAG: hypothetical protein K9J75_02900 [Cyanobium usitatum Tobar12.5m-G36]|nr:hypothetical protein [Cyanobium usitatum Tobar12.5m-G36]
MNFHKSATALVLVTMALTSCKSPASDSSESAPQSEETISMAKACKEALPLFTELGGVVAPIVINAKSGASNDDNVARFNSILDKLDGIAESIETEEGRTALLDTTKGWDKVLEEITNGENAEDTFKALEEAAKAFDDQCK